MSSPLSFTPRVFILELLELGVLEADFDWLELVCYFSKLLQKGNEYAFMAQWSFSHVCGPAVLQVAFFYGQNGKGLLTATYLLLY